MDIHPANGADAEAIERLRLETFSHTATSALRGVAPAQQLAVRMNFWQLSAHLRPSFLVAKEGNTVAGVIALATQECNLRFHWRHWRILRPLGRYHRARYLAIWALTHYEPAPNEVYQYSLTVAPAYRRCGVGGKLLAAAEAQAQRLGKTVACALIDRSNTPSLHLYQKQGYCLLQPSVNGWRRLFDDPSTYVRVEKQLSGNCNAPGRSRTGGERSIAASCL